MTSLTKSRENPQVLRYKISATKLAFKDKAFKDGITAYANQPLERITIDSFKQKVAWIQEYFPQMSGVEIETQLRQAILLKHSTEALDAVKAEYTNSDYDTPYFIAVKDEIKTLLRVRQADLQTELSFICATNRFDRILYAAYERCEAEVAMNQAKTELLVLIQKLGIADPCITRKKTELQEKFDAFKAADKSYMDIAAELVEITQCQLDTIILSSWNCLQSKKSSSHKLSKL
jgi:hypothetical protein